MNKSTTCKASEIILLLLSALETAVQEKLEPNGKSPEEIRINRSLENVILWCAVKEKKPKGEHETSFKLHNTVKL